MSYQQYFGEVEAVCEVLGEYVSSIDDGAFPPGMNAERFAAMWQAVELLSRAYAVLVPMVATDLAKTRLNLPDVVTSEPV